MKKLVIVLCSLILALEGIQAKDVVGKVSCEGKALGGVIVTDGVNFTRTGRDGKFCLEVGDNARFVHIVTPSGYSADFSDGAPRFFIPADSESFNFELKKIAKGKDFTLLSISDPQMRDDEMFSQFCKEPLEDLLKVSEEASESGAPAAAIVLGDISWDNMSMFKMYKDVIAKAKIPFYTVIGNHDFNRNLKGDSARNDFCSAFGPLDFAFFLGEDLVIGLNNIIYDTDKKYDEGYSEEELTFVKNLLELVPQKQHIFIAQHSPLRIWYQDRDVIGADKMLEILEGRKVDFLSGHTHIIENLTYSKDISEHNANSICGSWWSTLWTPDGAPRGYEIFSSKKGRLSWKFHPVDYPESFHINLYRKEEKVIANIWDWDSSWTVTYEEDGTFKGEMTQTQDCDPEYVNAITKAMNGKKIPGYKLPHYSDHYFMCEPSANAKVISVTATDPFGIVYKEEIKLND